MLLTVFPQMFVYADFDVSPKKSLIEMEKCEISSSVLQKSFYAWGHFWVF